MQLYKMYVGIFCISQTFTIKKVVSSRYDLNDEENNKKYGDNIPKLKIYDEEQINFDEAPRNNVDVVYDLPNEEELEESEKFGKENKRKTFVFREDMDKANEEEVKEGEGGGEEEVKNDGNRNDIEKPKYNVKNKVAGEKDKINIKDVNIEEEEKENSHISRVQMIRV